MTSITLRATRLFQVSNINHVKTSFSTVEGFFKKYNNYPVSLIDSVSLATKGGDFGVYGVGPVISSTGEGRAFGVEIMNRTKISNKLNITASYTFYRSQMKDKNGTFISTNWDNRHLVSITSTYNFNKSWSVGAKWRYAGGSPYTPYDLELHQLKKHGIHKMSHLKTGAE